MLNKCLIAVKSKNEWKNNTFDNPLGGTFVHRKF